MHFRSLVLVDEQNNSVFLQSCEHVALADMFLLSVEEYFLRNYGTQLFEAFFNCIFPPFSKPDLQLELMELVA